MIDIYNREPDEVIKHFLRCSITSEWRYFRFDLAFDSLLHVLENKLNEHGMLGFEEFYDYHQNTGLLSEDCIPLDFTCSTDYIYISKGDVLEAILKLHYDKSIEAFSGLFKDLLDLYNRIESNSYTNLQLNIELFDELIYAIHTTGQLFDLDIDSLKEEVENEISEEVL